MWVACGVQASSMTRYGEQSRMFVPIRTRLPSWNGCGWSTPAEIPALFAAGTPQVRHFQESPLEKVVPSVLTTMTWSPVKVLPAPDDGAPANRTGNTTPCPSHRYAGPSAIPWSDGSRHPVLCGLAVESQEPAAVDGAVGGSGNSLTATGSGFGAGGLLRTSGMKSFAQPHWAARFQVAI